MTMNVVPVPQSSGLVPANMSEAMQLAEMMAKSQLVPEAFRGKPADCLLVIMQAVRWQMDAFAVIQECSVIHGKLMYSGKLCAAVINARGNLTKRLSFSYDGQGENRTVIVSGLLSGEAETRTVSVRLRDAKTNNKVWNTQPDQQLAYHASRVWGRRHAPELLLGVYSPEEFEEPPWNNGDTAPQELPHPATLSEASPIVPQLMDVPDHDEKTGETGPRILEWPNGEKASVWAKRFIEHVRKEAHDSEQLLAWRVKNWSTLDTIRQAPKLNGWLENELTLIAKSFANTAPLFQEPQVDPDEVLKAYDTALSDCEPDALDSTIEAWADRINQLLPPDQTFATELEQSHRDRLKVPA